MEFFEKAHVVARRKISSKKDGKSQENVKKKLRQMLYGYRHSDNELIKDSGDIKNDFDDSSSVSGYSDLNLTNSSFDADKTEETVSSGNKDISISESNETNLDNSREIPIDSIEEDTNNSTSISEYEQDVKSLSEDLSPDKLDTEYSNNSEDESDIDDFIETATDIDSTSNDDIESVDTSLKRPIGQETRKSPTKKSKKDKKAKKEDVHHFSSIRNMGNYKGPYRPNNITDDEIEVMDVSMDMSNISLPDTIEYKGPFRPKHDDSSEIVLSDNFSEDSSLHSVALSSPFVSISATDMEHQNLSDILGEYKYPTVRNLPTDSHIVVGDNTLFETENASIVDIQTEEDSRQIDDEVGSLIPEIDNDLAIEDVEIDQTGLDSSHSQPLEETTEYDNTEETSQRESDTDSYIPTLNIPVNVYYGSNNTCILILKHPAELYIHGKVKLDCLGGSVEILGHTLQDQTYNVYAPNYNYAQRLKTVENDNAYYGLFSKLTPSVTVAEAEEIVTSIGKFDGVLCLQPLKSRQMEFVENNFTIADLFRRPSRHIDNCLKKASEVLECSLYVSRPWKSFEENNSWKQAIACGMNKDSRGIVCGGKGVGKSTFLRYHINKLLAVSPVLVVDLDPGQCEFTVAGNVSATVVTDPLLGPNFTHLGSPELSLNVGLINTMDNPRRYANAVQALITHCSSDERLNQLPWIVNTMGMTNTVGLKFMTLIILLTKPTFLLQIDSKNVKKRFDFHLYPQTVKNLYFEDYQNDDWFRDISEVDLDYAFFLAHHAENSKNYSLAPRDERYLNFLSYFGQILNVKNGDFLSIVPYEVNLKDLNIGLNVKIDENVVSKVINGKVVALCQQEATVDTKVFTLSDTPLRCLGAGLIRGVDWEKGVLYVLTPVEGELLVLVDTLVYCDWAPELRGSERGLPDGTALPYRTASLYHHRQFVQAPRRRFNPVQLIKMSKIRTP